MDIMLMIPSLDHKEPDTINNSVIQNSDHRTKDNISNLRMRPCSVQLHDILDRVRLFMIKGETPQFNNNFLIGMSGNI
jgi:hypothetical protein